LEGSFYGVQTKSKVKDKDLTPISEGPDRKWMDVKKYPSEVAIDYSISVL
jgi:hypothetical protein